MPLEVIAHSPDCEGGNCPTIWRDPGTGDYFVQGIDPTDPTGKRETMVRIPAGDWAFLVAQLPR